MINEFEVSIEDVKYFGTYKSARVFDDKSGIFASMYSPTISQNQLFGFKSKNDFEKWLSNDKRNNKIKVSKKQVCELIDGCDKKDIRNRICIILYV